MKTIVDLMREFSLPNENNENSPPIQPLTPQQLCNILQKLFGNTIHLIDPKLSLKDLPLYPVISNTKLFLDFGLTLGARFFM